MTDVTATMSTISIATTFTILQNTWHDRRDSDDVNYKYCYNVHDTAKHMA